MQPLCLAHESILVTVFAHRIRQPICSKAIHESFTTNPLPLIAQNKNRCPKYFPQAK